MWDVFLSYSSADQGYALELRYGLSAYGLNVWFDERQIGGGEVIVNHIADGVARSNAAILLISGSFLKSQWTMTESRFVGNRYIEDQYPVIPVLKGTTIKKATAAIPWLGGLHLLTASESPTAAARSVARSLNSLDAFKSKNTLDTTLRVHNLIEASDRDGLFNLAKVEPDVLRHLPGDTDHTEVSLFTAFKLEGVISRGGERLVLFGPFDLQPFDSSGNASKDLQRLDEAVRFLDRSARLNPGPMAPYSLETGVIALGGSSASITQVNLKRVVEFNRASRRFKFFPYDRLLSDEDRVGEI